MTNLVRILKNSWKNFYRNLWLSVATLFMMFIALAVVGALFLFDASLNTFVAGLHDRVDVSVYFAEDAEEDEILSMKEELEERDDIQLVQYISKDEALEIFTDRHHDNEILLESLEELDRNPLQASINIKAHQPDQFSGIVESIESTYSSSLIDNINFRENEMVINSITTISEKVSKTGFFLTIILTVLVAFVTLNTIRLAIYTSKDEIHIMKLVGGSNWFVRTPFVLTGALFGLISALLVIGSFYLGTRLMDNQVSLIFADLDFYGYLMANITAFVALILASGLALGTVSSWIAVRRYLQV